MLASGPSAHQYTTFADSNRIDKAEIQTEQQSKEARIKRRLQRIEAEDIDNAVGSLLYGAGIDDSMYVGKNKYFRHFFSS